MLYLLAHDGYPYNGRFFDRSPEVEGIRTGLPGLESTMVPGAGSGIAGAVLVILHKFLFHRQIAVGSTPCTPLPPPRPPDARLAWPRVTATVSQVAPSWRGL